MVYEQALEYIYSLPRFSIKTKDLNRVFRMLKELGNPQEKLKYIHIGGTNGKGSVSTFCAQILQEAGLKVGLFRSPHVINFCDRIEINGSMITKEDLVTNVERLKKINEELIKRNVTITVFDFITVLALQYFLNKACDIVVLEVGLGGKFDATNVISSSLVTIFTHIDYDHLKELAGKTGSILEIVEDKSNILKKNGVCVCDGRQYFKVLEFLKKKSIEKNVRLIKAYSPNKIRYTRKCTVFYFNGIRFKIKLLGEHQVDNAMVAVTTALYLKYPIKYIKKGLKKTFIPARFEIVSKKPIVVLDAAHNENGIESLVKTLSKFKNNPKIGVISISKTKNFVNMLMKIKNVFDLVIFTKMTNFMAINPVVLHKEATKLEIKCIVEQSFKSAIKISEKLALKKGMIVFFGSLYFVSDIRQIFKRSKDY